MRYELLVPIGIVAIISASFVFSVVGFIGILRNSLRMVSNIQEGTSTIRNLWGSRFNVIFRPQYLNSHGVAARQKLFRSAAIFIVSSAVLLFTADYIGALI